MSHKFRWTFVAIVALQLLFLLGLVAYKESTLRFGRTVVLQTVPVDPRDLFRGDYVNLRYQVSTFNANNANALRLFFDPPLERGDTVYVRLAGEPSPDGHEVWRGVGVARRPGAGWDVFIKGTVDDVAGQTYYPQTVRVKYGIESYFVPEGQGREIERARDVKVKVAVNGFGEAVIKELIVDGVPWKPK